MSKPWFHCIDLSSPIVLQAEDSLGAKGVLECLRVVSEALSLGIHALDELTVSRWAGVKRDRAAKVLPHATALLEATLAMPGVKTSKNLQKSTGNLPEIYPKSIENLQKSTKNLVDFDPSNPHGSTRDQKKERKKEKNTPLPPLQGERPTGAVPGFEKFWSAYPKKEARKKALDSWQRLKLESQAETILAALASYVTCDQWIRDGGKFIPHATTWLNQERWKEKPFQPSIGPPPIPKIVPASERKEGVLSWD